MDALARIPLPTLMTSNEPDKCMYVAGREYTLNFIVTRTPITQSAGIWDGRPYTPHYPKAKTEGWFLGLVDGGMATSELITLRRITTSVTNNRTPIMNVSLTFVAPDVPGPYLWIAILMSDTYLGLDTQAEVSLNVVPARR